MNTGNLTPRQILFIEAHASGRHDSASAAARHVGYADTRAHVTASQILARPDAKRYLKSLQEETSKSAGVDRERLARFYLGILEARPDQAGNKNPLCNSIPTKEGSLAVFPDKLAAAAALTKLLALDKPAEDPGANKLAGALEAIFNRRDI